MKKYTQILTILAAFGISLPSWAKVIYYGSELETIPVSSSGPTILKFPSEVKTISQAKRFKIEPANPDTPNYALLSVEPRVPSGSSDVVFILSDGSIIKTKLKVISQDQPEKGDSIYELKSKETLLPNETEKAGSSVNVSELELMKALIRGDSVTGYSTKSVSRKISPGFKGIDTRLVKIYTGNGFNGYVFEIKNETEKELHINLQNLAIGDPNVALLSNVDHDILTPEGKEGDRTFLRIVAKPNSLFQQLILPIQMIEQRNEKKAGSS